MSDARNLDSIPRATQAQPRRQLRLDTIIRLRWLAVLGQTAAVFVVAYGRSPHDSVSGICRCHGSMTRR